MLKTKVLRIFFAAILGLGISGVGQGVIAQQMAVITTTDYNIGGNLASIVEGETTAATNLLLLHSDLVVTAYEGYVYVIERKGGDNIIKLDPNNLGESGVIYQKSVGNDSNPQDIAFVSENKAYVSRHSDTALWIIDPSTGDKIGEVDLSGFVAYAGTDSAEAVPQMSSMAIAGGKLYVVCQRLKGWDPGDVSLIVVIDIASDTVIKPIELERKNPCDIALFGGKLYVACTGSWSDPTDGGLEVIDTAADTNQGVLISETELGGNLSGVAVVSASKGYVLVMGTWPNTVVKSFDPQTSAVGEALVGATSAADAEFNGSGKLYVADRSTEHPGIYIYDTFDDQLIAGPISTGLPPNCIAFVDESATYVAEETSPELMPLDSSLGQNYPNPFNASTVIPYQIGGTEESFVRIEVYDLLGRRVKTLVCQQQDPGTHLAIWDGRDLSGEPVSSGMYVIKLEVGGNSQTVKATLLK
jgi:hypothetical protein